MSLQMQHQIFYKPSGTCQDNLHYTMSQCEHSWWIQTIYAHKWGKVNNLLTTTMSKRPYSAEHYWCLLPPVYRDKKLELGTVLVTTSVGYMIMTFLLPPSIEDFRKSSSSGNSCRFLDFSKNPTAPSWKSSKLPSFMSSASEGIWSAISKLRNWIRHRYPACTAWNFPFPTESFGRPSHPQPHQMTSLHYSSPW